MLQFDKWHDSSYEDNTWMDQRQRFLSSVHKRLKYFPHVFNV